MQYLPLPDGLLSLMLARPDRPARIIIPIAISGLSGNINAIANPISGKIINWLVKPTNIAFGYTIILLKSSKTNDNPIPNIIIMREEARIIVEISSIF